MTPYADLPEHSFWKTGVCRADPLTIDTLYQPKFPLTAEDRIATAGSCFAQHVTGALKAGGFRVMDVEPGPPPLDAETLRGHGYGLYSARYGNIYTARQLLQLAREAFEDFHADEIAWERKGRFYDALRPGVDPRGLDTPEEVIGLRAHHVRRVADLFSRMDVLIFTLGLTEAWIDTAGTTVFPTAPGVIAGRWDPARYRFVNFTMAEVLGDLRAFCNLIARHNPGFRMILTVSPVPLTATATDNHVLLATTYSKSVLRAAAGELAAQLDNVDYFPSFELIATPFSRGTFYQPDLRGVTDGGVQNVMRVFMGAHPTVGRPEAAAAFVPDETHCEDVLAEAFAP